MRLGPLRFGPLIDARDDTATWRLGGHEVVHVYASAVATRLPVRAVPGFGAERERGRRGGLRWVRVVAPPSWTLLALAERARATAAPPPLPVTLALASRVAERLSLLPESSPVGVDPVRVRVDRLGDVQLVSPWLHARAPAEVARRSDRDALVHLLAWLTLLPLAATRWLSMRRVIELAGHPEPWAETPGFPPLVTRLLTRRGPAPPLADLARELRRLAATEDEGRHADPVTRWVHDLRLRGVPEDSPPEDALAELPRWQERLVDSEEADDLDLPTAETTLPLGGEDVEDLPTEPTPRRTLRAMLAEEETLVAESADES